MRAPPLPRTFALLALAAALVFAAARWIERDSDHRVTSVSTTTSAIRPAVTTWKLSWSDDFDQGTLDATKWRVESSRFGHGNDELQCYTPENVSVRDGNLVLEARRQTVRCPQQSQDFTSGMVRGNLPIRQGAVEIRARMPSGAGMLPALWMLPVERVYGPDGKSGEIDIVEVNTTKPDVAHGTVHWHYPDCGWGCSRYGGEFPIGEPGLDEEFHTYRLEWGPGRIAWFVDGIGYYELGDNARRRWSSEAVNPVAGSVEYPKPFDEHNPMYLIMNVAVGGKWPGTPPASTRFPSAMLVDWVKVYEAA